MYYVVTVVGRVVAELNNCRNPSSKRSFSIDFSAPCPPPIPTLSSFPSLFATDLATIFGFRHSGYFIERMWWRILVQGEQRENEMGKNVDRGGRGTI